MEEALRERIKKLIFNLGDLQPGETICLLHDEKTSSLAEKMANYLYNQQIPHQKISLNISGHGQEPPDHVADSMKSNNLILGLTSFSLAHTQARFEANKVGSKYLSLPDYSEAVLLDDCFLADFHNPPAFAKQLTALLSDGDTVRITTNKGTDINLYIHGRKANFHPGIVNDQIKLGSPPDIEVNIAPQELYSNGRIVVDGSVTHPDIGKLENEVTLIIEDGYISNIDGEKDITDKISEIFDSVGTKNSRILAELGIGFNPMAKLTGNMLIDEGTMGTFHFGFGSNITIGGENEVKFHTDFVFYANTIFINNKQYFI